jgi:hypothetical protein
MFSLDNISVSDSWILSGVLGSLQGGAEQLDRVKNKAAKSAQHRNDSNWDPDTVQKDSSHM